MISTNVSIVLGDPRSVVESATVNTRIVAPDSTRPLATITIGAGGMDLTISSAHPTALLMLAEALTEQAAALVIAQGGE